MTRPILPLTHKRFLDCPLERSVGSQPILTSQLSANLRALCSFALSFTFLFLSTFLSSCGTKPATASADSLFPSSVAPNWSRTDEIRTYPPAKLYEYIDGDAEKYLRAQVQSTSTTDYKFQNKFDAVADIYTFTDQSGAKAIFDSEPSSGAATPPIGDAARLYEQSLMYRKGRYLVRIVAYQATPQIQQGLVDLGKSIEPNLSK